MYLNNVSGAPDFWSPAAMMETPGKTVLSFASLVKKQWLQIYPTKLDLEKHYVGVKAIISKCTKSILHNELYI